MPDPRNRLTWNATCKVYPAIADLQAPESIVRVAISTLCVAGPNTIDVYTVPAGKLFQMQCNIALASRDDPTDVFMLVKSNGDNYNFAYFLYGPAWEVVLTTIPMLLNEGEIIKHIWSNCTTTTNVYDRVMGYLIDKY